MKECCSWYGGEGSDTFIFDFDAEYSSTWQASDVIQDFNINEDKIQIYYNEDNHTLESIKQAMLEQSEGEFIIADNMKIKVDPAADSTPYTTQDVIDSIEFIDGIPGG